MDVAIKKLVDALYEGKFGTVFSRTNTKIKRFKKANGLEVLIRHKDPTDKKNGIQIIIDYRRHSFEIKFRGKSYEKLAQKIKKYFKKYNLNNGVIEKV